MAHFAEINENNVVTRVIVVANTDIIDNEVESEAKGIEFCKNLLGQDTTWVQTSYNGTFRKRYAGEGFTYNVEFDAFIPPKPYSSWSLNPITLLYDPPVPRPSEGVYVWDEPTLSWVQL